MPEEDPPANPDVFTPPPPEKPQLAAVQTSLLGNTPWKESLSTHRVFANGGTIEQKRDALVEYVGDVPEVSTDFLYQSVLQHSIFNTQPALLDEIEAALIKNRKLTKKGRWALYPTNPKAMKGKEDVVFAPLVPIIEAIVTATHNIYKQKGKGKGKGKGQKTAGIAGIAGPTIKFKQEPDKVPLGERQMLTRPDITGILNQCLESILPQFRTYSWFNLALPGELKKYDTDEDVLDNARKIIWSAKHILSNDPARRFVLGFTIEDTCMRIWFMSRSQIMASETFDFISTPRELIKAAVTFSFADKEDLGFDSTIIQFKRERNQIQYKIQLNGVTYVTIRPLSDYRADALRGRATRVWLVHVEGEPGVRYVLKDVWIPSDSLKEGDQLELLHKELELISVPMGTPHPSEFFLTVQDHGFVTLSDETDDDTGVLMGGKTIPSDAKSVALFRKNKEESSKTASTSHRLRNSEHGPSQTMRYKPHGLPPAPLHSGKGRRDKKYYAPRIHYRIVFKEVGRTVYDLNSVPEVMKALSDAIQGLKYMHQLGLVHRDVSPGNILVVNGTAKIADLEYMKIFRKDNAVPGLGQRMTPRNAESDLKEDKTGTAAFLAVEVWVNKYLFIPAERKNETTGSMEVISRRKGDRFSTFICNPLHDMESTYWIALWVLTSKTTKGTTKNARQNAIKEERFTLESFPKEFSPAVKALLHLRSALFVQYSRFESSLEFGHLKLEETTETFAEQYAMAADEAEHVPFENSTDSEQEAARKRSPRTAFESEDDYDDEDMLPTVDATEATAAHEKRRSGPQQGSQKRPKKVKSGPVDPSEVHDTDTRPRRSSRLGGQIASGVKSTRR
ncbi:hypothetical protein C8R43DRAFT_1020821 [Mycena crocata]|nr:hypothetical protein C8R43DRAFT_1020821 [Mycena crocata]